MVGEEDRLRQQAWDAGNVATVGMILTGVGAVGATVLWITLPGADSGKETALNQPDLRIGPFEKVQVGVRPGGLQVRGTF